MSRPRTKKQRKQLGRNGKAVLAAFVLLCVAAMGYMVLVRPKQAEAKELEAQIAEIESRIATHPKPTPAGDMPDVVVADLFRMAKAMPDRLDMPGLLLELNRVAKDSGIVFESLSPGPPSPGAGYQTVPVSIALSGDFYTLSDFLFRLRNLVQMRDGQLTATGRLFTVQSITFSPTEGSALKATLEISAFVYGGAPVPAAAEPATTGETATGETATGETTTAPEPEGSSEDPSQPPEPPTAAPAPGESS